MQCAVEAEQCWAAARARTGVCTDGIAGAAAGAGEEGVGWSSMGTTVTRLRPERTRATLSASNWWPSAVEVEEEGKEEDAGVNASKKAEASREVMVRCASVARSARWAASLSSERVGARVAAGEEGVDDDDDDV